MPSIRTKDLTPTMISGTHTILQLAISPPLTRPRSKRLRSLSLRVTEMCCPLIRRPKLDSARSIRIMMGLVWRFTELRFVQWSQRYLGPSSTWAIGRLRSLKVSWLPQCLSSNLSWMTCWIASKEHRSVSKRFFRDTTSPTTFPRSTFSSTSMNPSRMIVVPS